LEADTAERLQTKQQSGRSNKQERADDVGAVAGVEAVRNAIQVLQDLNNAAHLLQGQSLPSNAKHDRKRGVIDTQ